MQLSHLQLSLLLPILAAVQFAIGMVFVEMIFDEKSLFGMVEWGGFLTPNLGNWWLLFLLRSIVGVCGIPLLAKVLYPLTGQDLKHQLQHPTRSVLWVGIISGLCLFVAEWFMYFAVGFVPLAVAIASGLLYPTIATIGAWKLWGDRPTPLLVLAMTMVAIASFVAVPLPRFFVGTLSDILWGMSAAAVSSLAFASYLLLTQRATRQLHPLPFTAIALGTVFVLSCLVGMLPVDLMEITLEPRQFPTLVVGGAIVGVLTLVGYLLSNYGVVLVGAARSAIAIASMPTFTILLTVILFQSALEVKQILGILGAILGLVVLMSEPPADG